MQVMLNIIWFRSAIGWILAAQNYNAPDRFLCWYSHTVVKIHTFVITNHLTFEFAETPFPLSLIIF